MENYLFNLNSPIEFISVGKSDLPADFIHYKRKVDYFILYFLMDGEFYLNCDGQNYAFQAGDVFLMKPNVLHYGTKPSAVKFYWMHFTTDCFEILDQYQADQFFQAPCEDKIIIPLRFSMKKIANYIILINQLINSSQTQKKLISKYLSSSILIEIANQYQENYKLKFSSNDISTRRFQEIINYIDANYKENLKVQDIAQKFGYNEKYLSKLFKKSLNMTIKEYIIDNKLKAAAFLLLVSNDTVASVAYDCGFSNEFYFMRLFKRKYQLTPTSYRNNFRSQNYTRYFNPHVKE